MRTLKYLEPGMVFVTSTHIVAAYGRQYSTKIAAFGGINFAACMHG